MHQDAPIDETIDFAPLARGFTERRKDSPMPVLLELLKQVHESQKGLDRKLDQHIALETGDLKSAIADLIRDSFPDGDPDGHRRHHELVIKREEERLAFWLSMRTKLAEWGLVGFAGWAIYVLWVSFLKGPVK